MMEHHNHENDVKPPEVDLNKKGSIEKHKSDTENKTDISTKNKASRSMSNDSALEDKHETEQVLFGLVSTSDNKRLSHQENSLDPNGNSLSDGSESGNDSTINSHRDAKTVVFKNNTEISQSEMLSVNAIGGLHTLVSESTQTDWENLNDNSDISFNINDVIKSKGSTPRDKIKPNKIDKSSLLTPMSKLDNSNSLENLIENDEDDYFTEDESVATTEPVEVNIQDTVTPEQAKTTTLPSIGPPPILQYPIEKTSLESVEIQLLKRSTVSATDIFSGNCEFCSQPVKPPPSLDDQKTKAPEELYCCSDYKEFLVYTLTHPLEKTLNGDKAISIKPHPPFGSKQDRRFAKERAAQRMRDRELARQQAAITVGNTQQTTNFYQFARQMKTINYQLSSARCLEEGWTLRPPSPLLELTQQANVFEPDASNAPGKPGEVIRQFYDNGSPFLTVLPDRTGNVYYPTGSTAVSILQHASGYHSYIVHGAAEQNHDVMAVFEPTGCAATYFPSGHIRLYMDAFGGVELAADGRRRRKWSWRDQTAHVHAPPLQPITFAITPSVSVRVVDQHNVTLTFGCGSRSCRFKVGARVKQDPSVNPSPPPPVDDDQVFREDARVYIESLFDKVSYLLKFPRSSSTRVERIPPSPQLANKIRKSAKRKELLSARLELKEKKPPSVSVS